VAEAINGERLNPLKAPLRLPYAIHQGPEPGLWKPEDIVAKPEDRTFGAKLRNLGSAVWLIDHKSISLSFGVNVTAGCPLSSMFIAAGGARETIGYALSSVLLRVACAET
jgi:hypothetical protein